MTDKKGFTRCLIAIILLVVSMVISANQALIIDTDMGSDDWIATLYLLNNPAVTVKGIIITGDGASEQGDGIRMAAYLLNLTSQQGTVLLTRGESHPITGHQPYPPSYRQANHEEVQRLTPNLNTHLTSKTIFIHQMQQTDNIYIALGPLTTLAKWQGLHPRIQHVYVMGGAINVAGNIPYLLPHSSNKVAEWNIYSDPVAAQRVFNSDLAITLVPLDITQQVPLSSTTVKRLSGHSPITHFLQQVLAPRLPSIKRGEYQLWDPLAAILAINPSFYQQTLLPIQVITQQGASWGNTQQSAQAKPIGVVTHVNTTMVTDHLVKTLKNKTFKNNVL